MNGIKKKIWMVIASAQVLVVGIAFALMVFFSYKFMSGIERAHLIRDVNEAITHTQSRVFAELLEPETALRVISENINSMILNNAGNEQVGDYIKEITKHLFANRRYDSSYVTGVYGVFDAFGGFFFDGAIWIPPENYNNEDQSWYVAAVNAAGKVAVTAPYDDLYTGKKIITFSRSIMDSNGSLLGVISLNVMLDHIRKIVTETYGNNGGYGILMDSEFKVLAHPHPAYLGKPINEVSKDPVVKKIVKQGVDISECKVMDYKGDSAIISARKLDNGWYMAVVASPKGYYQSLNRVAVILILLGAGLAVILSAILIYIAKARNRADEQRHAMFEATPLCAVLWDKNLNSIDCNQEAVRLFGVSARQEFIEKYNEFSPEHQPDGSLSSTKSAKFVKKAFDDGYCRFDWEHKNKNGELIPTEITLVRINFKSDYMVAGYIRDLREYRQMMESVRQHSKLLDTVNLAAIVLLSNYNNESFETSLLKSFELVGTCLDVDRVQIWRNEMINGELHFTHSFQWLSKYGSTCVKVQSGLSYPYSERKEWENLFLHREYINAPLSDLPHDDRSFLSQYEMKSIVIIPMFLDDKFWGLFSIDDCRRERVFSKEEISILSSAGLMMTIAINQNIQNVKVRDAEERMQLLFNTSPFSCSMFNEDFNVMECNQETLKLFELPGKAEYIEKFRDLSPEYQPCGKLSKIKMIDNFQKAIKDGYYRFEWTHQKLNGESIPAEITLVRVKHREEYSIAAYVRDLRELKALMTEMRKAEIAEESNRAKSNFLARMSHEIRTPMNAILGIAEIQLQDDTLPRITKEALSRIYNSGDLLLAIINDILDLSKIEAGKLELMLDKYDISSLINDAVQLNIMRFESKPILFKLQVDENIPTLLIGDELRIKQILNNILSNAYKYTHEGLINLSVGTEKNSGKDGFEIMLVFRISDTGQGMTQEQVNKLGIEYTRFNLDANRATGGTGLGMSITQHLIKMMDGNMTVESVPGMGSTFTVYLPQGDTGSSPLGKELAGNLEQFNITSSSQLKKAQIIHEFMPYGRVLVVDDVETNIYVARGLMAPYGLSIDTSFSGYEAIDKIRAGNIYDIVFMDHMMPKMDGIEAAKIIRSLGYTKPIIALTANALAGMAEIFLDNGFDDFISKPIDIRQLNMVLNKLVRDKHPSEVVEAAREQKSNVYTSGVSQSTVISPKLAEIFVKDAKKSVSVLEAIYMNNCRRADDVSMFIINIHAIKSALANIGEKELSAEAFKLEQLGRDRKSQEILTETPLFLNKLRDVIEKISMLEAAEEDSVTTEGDKSFLHEKLLAIQKAAEIMDKKTVKDALAELKFKKWPRSVKDLLNVIAEHLLHSEFDEAAHVAQQALAVSDIFYGNST